MNRQANPGGTGSNDTPTTAPADDTHVDGLARASRSEKRVRQIGMAIVLAVFVGMGAWAVLAPLSSAASAPGIVAVENYRKPVQHLEGGIVKAIHVRDGQRIARNALLVTLDDAQARSQYEIVRGQLFASLAREARLLAQRDGRANLTFPQELLAHKDDPRVQESLAIQEQTFRARSAAYNNEAASLRERIGQLHAQADGVRAQRGGRERLVRSYAGELEDFTKLLAEGYSDKQRVRELERNLAEAEAQLGDLSSNLASIELQVSETKLRILQVQRDFQREVADELAEVQGQLFEVRARLQNLEPTLARTEIRAPYTGVVLNLTVHAVGGVIAAGEKLMDIVPDGEKLVIEAQVSPLDIDRVAVGQLADVHFPAFKTNRLTRIEGKLVAVSADSIVDPKAERPAPYYLARVEVTPAGLAVLQGDNYALVAGMPADVLIKTGQRSLFDYIVEPLSDTARRAFNED